MQFGGTDALLRTRLVRGLRELVRPWTGITMKMLRRIAWLNLLCAFAVASTGCSPTQPFYMHSDCDLSHHLDSATEISFPLTKQRTLADAAGAITPFNIENIEEVERWKLTLEEAISIAMQNSHVMRSLGGRPAQPVGQSAGSPPGSLSFNPDFSSTAYDPAIQETSNTGVEAALANFDAQLQTRLTWDRQDRLANTLQDVSQFFQQSVEADNVNFEHELSKRTVSGTQWFARNVTTYTSNNNPTRRHFSDWLTSFELEARHPLLRGSGVQVNRVPVMLARINTDIAISDFEINVRDFVYEVEQAYWELVFHYHNLDAARTGFSSAHATWQGIDTRVETGSAGSADEAQSRGQFYTFRARQEQALSDLLRQESRLRYLLGIAPTDGRLIMPVDAPTRARVEFDWNGINQEALIRSPELRRQRWRLEQNEIQVLAARNQLLPQLDLVALYRLLGQGDNLRIGSRDGLNFNQDGSSAFDTLTEGDFAEWQLGFQYQQPIGYRAEMTQVRNTQLQLRRSQKRLEDLELEITHQLSSGFARLRDRYRIAQTQYNTLKAYRDQVKAAKVAYDQGTITLNIVLDAQSRQAQAESDYFRALLEYNLAIAEVHLRKGSLLEHDGVVLSEGPWTAKAYQDSLDLARQRDGSYYLDYGFSRPGVVSQGPVPRFAGSPAIAPANSLPPAPAVNDGGVFGTEVQAVPIEGVPIEGVPVEGVPIDGGVPIEGMPVESFPIESGISPSMGGEVVSPPIQGGEGFDYGPLGGL